MDRDCQHAKCAASAGRIERRRNPGRRQARLSPDFVLLKQGYSLAFAVTRLTSSNFVGCCTGMSAVIGIEQRDQVLSVIPETGSFAVRRN